MPSKQIKLAVLKRHRDNLAEAKTLEEYKMAHVAYIETIIKDIEAAEAAEDFVNFRWTVVTDKND